MLATSRRFRLTSAATYAWVLLQCKALLQNGEGEGIEQPCDSALYQADLTVLHAHDQEPGT